MRISIRALGRIFHLAMAGSVVLAAVLFHQGFSLEAWVGVGVAVLAGIGGYAAREESIRALRDGHVRRRLTDDQRHAIHADLAPRPFPIEVDWDDNPEARAFALELSAVFSGAGCQVIHNGPMPHGNYWGLLGPGPRFDDVSEAQRVRAAFRAAKLNVRPVLDKTANLRIIVGYNWTGDEPPSWENTISSEDPDRH